MPTPDLWSLPAPGYATEAALGRLYTWLATSGLEMLIWIIGGMLVIRLIRWSANRYADRVEARFHESDLIVQSEDSKHRRAMVDVIAWTLIVIVVIVVIIHALSLFKIPIAGLAAPGAVLGAALGFGAQKVVQDVLAGFFVVAERQYGYGDMIRLTATAATTAEGTVEDVTLRMTRLRTSDGEVVTVPNGQVVMATNLSKDWARAVVDVPVPADADIGRVNDTLDHVGEQFYQNPRWHDLLLDAPSALGVISIELDSVTVRMVARTLPGKQFDVSRALRATIVQALATQGISVAPGHEVQAAGGPPATMAGETRNADS